jgi:hypothetical protein
VKYDVSMLFLTIDVLFQPKTATAAGGKNPEKGTKEHAEDTREDALPTEGVLPEVGEQDQDEGDIGVSDDREGREV